jgi:hypothetical protein
MIMIRIGTRKKEIHTALREEHVKMMPKRPKNRCLLCDALKSINAMKQANPLHPFTTNKYVIEKY